MNGWIVRQQPTTGAKHVCPDCQEEAAYVTVGSPQGQYMTAMACPACRKWIPIMLQEVER